MWVKSGVKSAMGGSLQAHLEHLAGMLHPGGNAVAGGGGSLAHHYAQHHNLQLPRPTPLHVHPRHVSEPARPGSPLPVHPLPHHFLLPEDDDGLADADEAGPPGALHHHDGHRHHHHHAAAFHHSHLPEQPQLLSQLSHHAPRHGSGRFDERCACPAALVLAPHHHSDSGCPAAKGATSW